MAIKKLHKIPPQMQRLYDRGITSVIPLLKGKAPGFKSWEKISDEEARGKVWSWSGDGEEHVNFGIRLGPQWGGLIDIDLDSKESRELAPYYLEESARFGRGGVCTHYLYRVGGRGSSVASKRYQWDKRDEKSVLLELRASGQTMGPGSVHPDTQEHVEWMCEDDLAIRDIEWDSLVKRVNNLAAASLLLRDWQSGGRDELAVCLVGSMVRAGWTDADIDSFLEPILVESGDEESVKRLKAERLRTELESGGRVPGLKRLRELCSGGGLGVAGFERIVEWLELGGGDLIEEFNAQFAVAMLRGGGVTIMREGEGDSGVEFLDQRSFGLMWANRPVLVGGREVTADKFWLSHKDRREYLRGVVFKPGREVEAGEYNLWRGFAVEELEGGEFGVGWELYLDHIREDVCGGDPDIWKWMVSWMAHRVQRPWEVPESAIVLIGERGDGKSSVFKILGRLFGRHYMTVTNPRHLMGNFNSHLMDKVLVLADEAVWGGDKTNEGILKVMISEDRRVVELKGKDSFEVDNCTAYGICSNNDWVVPVGRQERRFLIVRPLGQHRGDLDYWDRMYDQMSVEGGGLGRMLWDLRRWDLTGWRGNRPPCTAELRAQQSRGMEYWVQFLIELVNDERIVESGDWWADDLYDEYLVWCKESRHRPEGRIPFMENVQRMFPESKKTRVKREIWKSTRGVGVVSSKKARIKFVDVAGSVARFLNG